MRALVVGYGSMGQRHARNLRAVVPQAEIVVLRRPGGEHPQDAVVDTVCHSVEEALATSPEVAFITTPAPFHVELATVLAKRGVDLFIEKPLSDEVPAAAELVALCEQCEIVAMVGYNFRFYEPLQTVRAMLEEGAIGELLAARLEVGQYLPTWRPGRDYRETVSARRELGGGVLLELSHEFDILRWLCGEVRELAVFAQTSGALEIEVEDVAEAVMKMESGALANVHVDMLRHGPSRTLELLGSEGTITADLIRNHVRHFRAGADAWEDVVDRPDLDRNAMYLEELRHFLDCVQDRRAPRSDVREGLETLELVLAARQSAAERRFVQL